MNVLPHVAGEMGLQIPPMCTEMLTRQRCSASPVAAVPIIMISAMTRLCLDAQAPPNSGGAAMMVGGAAMMVGGVQ